MKDKIRYKNYFQNCVFCFVVYVFLQHVDSCYSSFFFSISFCYPALCLEAYGHL